MGKKYLIDTNILVYYLGNVFKDKARDFVQKAIEESFVISIITKIEILSYPKLSEDDETLINDFLSLANILSINDDIADRIIAIRRKNKIKIPDATIAAATIEHNLILLTRNIKDFTSIKGIKLLDPFTL